MTTLLVTLADAKEHVRVTTTATDTQLQNMVEVASDACQQYTGRTWATTTVTETHDGGKTAVALRARPIQSITTVTVNGSVLAGSGYYLDATAGVLYCGQPPWPTYWLPGVQNVTVTFVAGTTTLPPSIRHGVLEMTAHLWETQAGGAGRPRSGADSEWDPAAGFSIPRRVSELWRPYRAVGLG